jgi:hypothetical protein
MLALVMDNALPNDVCAQSVVDQLMERYKMELNVQHLQGRCVGHIINLVVQSLLHSMDKAFDDPDVLDYFTIDPDAPLHYSADDDPELQRMEGPEAAAADAEAVEMEMEMEDDDDLPCGSPLHKVCADPSHLQWCTHCSLALITLHQDCCLTSASNEVPNLSGDSIW